MSYRQPCSFHLLESINQLSGQSIQAVLVFERFSLTSISLEVSTKFRTSLVVSDRIQMLKMHPVRKIKSIVINQKALEMLKCLHVNGFFTSVMQ